MASVEGVWCRLKTPEEREREEDKGGDMEKWRLKDLLLITPAPL